MRVIPALLAATVAGLAACTSPLPQGGRELANQGPAVAAALAFWRAEGLPAPTTANVWFVDATCGVPGGEVRGFEDEGRCKGGTTVIGKGSWVALSARDAQYMQTDLCHELLHLTLGGDDGHAHPAWAREGACRIRLRDLPGDQGVIPGRVPFWLDPNVAPAGGRVLPNQAGAVAAAVGFWRTQGYAVPDVDVRFVDGTCGDGGVGPQGFWHADVCEENVTVSGVTFVGLTPSVTHYRQTTLCHAIAHLVLAEDDPAWPLVYGEAGCQGAVARAGDLIDRGL
jgi:hypothetical protein